MSAIAVDLDTIMRVLTLQDYNTRIVVLGTMLLGVATGLIGTYMLLRRRALIGDALSHATLPGIVIAFMVMAAFGASGKFLPGLLLGAAITGFLGVAATLAISRFTRIKPDAALGIVLSVSYGFGAALLGVAQRMSSGNQAGLERFIYGQAAALGRNDVLLITIAVAIALGLCVAFAKEFKLLSFDPDFMGAQGWPVGLIDIVMMLLVTLVVVIGLQAVGLILVIAMLIIPPAAARFWTNTLRTMLVLASVFGAISGAIGAAISALAPDLPAGAVIVCVASSVFVLSALIGLRRGVIVRALQHAGLIRRIRLQHLMRAMYEWLETRGEEHRATDHAVPIDALLRARSWSRAQLRRTLRRASRLGFIEPSSVSEVRLTAPGVIEAHRLVRNHRLWERYLIEHADIAPSHVDRDADQIEHVLAPDLVERLEALLMRDRRLPRSPHPIILGENREGRA